VPQYRPPGAFYFQVTMLGQDMVPAEIDGSFEEVSGLQAELQFETVPEGGENRFAHRLPTRTKFSNLVLKRGLVVRGSTLSRWTAETLGAFASKVIKPRGLNVILLGEKGDPLVTWTVYQAYPLRWQLAPLNSMDGKILTESLELTYSYFVRKDQAPSKWGLTG